MSLFQFKKIPTADSATRDIRIIGVILMMMILKLIPTAGRQVTDQTIATLDSHSTKCKFISETYQLKSQNLLIFTIFTIFLVVVGQWMDMCGEILLDNLLVRTLMDWILQYRG